MKDYVEERAIYTAKYIVENNTIVRQIEKEFIITNTMHMVVKNGTVGVGGEVI